MEEIKSESSEKSPLPCCPDTYNIFGEPFVRPRIGGQYQADIPELIMSCAHEKCDEMTVDDISMYILAKSFPMKPYCNLRKAINDGSFSIPLPRDATLNINRSSGFRNSNEICGSPSVGTVGGPSHEQSTGSGRSFEGGNRVSILGYTDHHWGDIEHGSFLLSLYIFGKNLDLVHRFVPCVGMGDILLFYYGKFYRSCDYQRWSRCGKLRRKGMYGKGIFKGWRLQELLSRLASKVTKECLDTLVQISRSLGERKLTIREYVFAVRDAVGVKLFVEAVGIGKGKQDLTSPDLEQPPRGSHTFLISPEIPVGKACSSLTSADIIRFLTGDFRLSKTRSSDLFWEAVWPRLLARGWHSEQLKGHGLTISNHSLIFLIPGVKKFSRRRLVKGSHYFNSVSDLLNKISLNPGLLEADTGNNILPTGFFGQVSHENFDSRGGETETSDSSDSSCDSNSSTCLTTETTSSRGNVPTNRLSLTMVDPKPWRQPHDTTDSSDVCREQLEIMETVVRDAMTPSESAKEGKTHQITPEIPSIVDTEHSGSSEKKEECGTMLRKHGPVSSLSNGKKKKKGKRKPSIDLNIPSVPLDFRIRGDSSSALGLLHYCVGAATERRLVKMENQIVQMSEGGGGNGGPQCGRRRQSTRNRPLTKKALEALESGFWAIERKNKKKKGVESLP